MFIPVERSYLLIAVWMGVGAMGSMLLAGEPATSGDLLAESIIAEGGRAKWESIQSYRSVSTKAIELGGKLSVKTREVLEINIPQARWRLKASDERDQLRVTIGDSERTTVYKKQNGETVGGADTPPNVPAMSESRQLLLQIQDLKFESGPLVAKERWTLKSENGMSQWLFGSKSFLLTRKLEKTDYGQSETRYSDYRIVDGLLLPFQITTTVKQAGYVVDQKFESIELNAAFDKTAFDFDDGWRKIKAGEKIPDFEFVDAIVDGKKWSRESMRGSFALLDFWATWCGPCVAEFPSLRETHRRFKDQGFAILAISLDSDRDQYLKYIKENIPEWGNVLVIDGFDSELVRQFELSSIPRTILIDPAGVIVAVDDDARGQKLIQVLEQRLSTQR